MIHDHDLDLDKREIYLFPREEYTYGEPLAADEEPGVDWMLSNRIIRNLNILRHAAPDKPILIHMKTCGGDWGEGMAIYDAVRSCPCHVTIVSYTHARSMSSLILQAADHRVLMPHSYFMFHRGTLGFDGTQTSFQSFADFNKVAQAAMLDIYQGKMLESELWRGTAPAKVLRWLNTKMNQLEEVYLTPQDAVDNGFADAVFNYDWSTL